MNKTFKKIWCCKRKTFVLTYEGVAAKGKSSGYVARCFKSSLSDRIKVVLNIIAVVIPCTAVAENFDPAAVVSGKASIVINSQQNQAVINQSTEKAIVNWHSFSVPDNGSAVFNQPDSKSITLNRIIGKQKTHIDGSIHANGQVWILNPNGTLVGKHGTINAHGFMATTQAISNKDFLMGNYQFDLKNDNSSEVVNLGEISVGSGYAILAGKNVNNSGIIVASVGKIVLGSGQRFIVDIIGDNLLSFEITERLNKRDGSISSLGRLKAAKGHILLAANDAEKIISDVVNAGDTVQANSVKIVGGSVIFTQKTSSNNGGAEDFQPPLEDFQPPPENVQRPPENVQPLVESPIFSPSEEEEDDENRGQSPNEDKGDQPPFEIVPDGPTRPVNQFELNDSVQIAFPSESENSLVRPNDQFNNQFDPNNPGQIAFPSESENNLVRPNDQFNNQFDQNNPGQIAFPSGGGSNLIGPTTGIFPVETFNAEIVGPDGFPVRAPNENFVAEPIGPDGQFVLRGPDGQVISPDGQPLNEDFLRPENNFPPAEFNPEKDRAEFFAQHGGENLDPCAVEPALCGNPQLNFQEDGQPFDPNQFFSNSFIPNPGEPFNQPGGFDNLMPEAVPYGDDSPSRGKQFDTADFFIAIDRAGLQGDELAGTFDQFGDAERFIETANLASEFGFDVRDVAQFAGKVDEMTFRETFSDVADVAQKFEDGQIIDDLAFVAAREGASIGEVLETAIDESYDVVRQISSMPPPGEFGPPAGDFGGPDVVDVGGGPAGDLGVPVPGDFGVLPPGGDLNPGPGDVGNVPGGPGPGEFLAPAPTDFAAPIPGDLAALPGDFAPPPGLDLGEIGEFGAEAASFGDFTEFGDIGAPPPGEVGVLPSGEIGPGPEVDLGVPPPGDIIDGGPPPGDGPPPKDGPPLADGPSDGSPPGDGPPPEELVDGPAGDDGSLAGEESVPESAQAAGEEPGTNDESPPETADVGGPEDIAPSDADDSVAEVVTDGPSVGDGPTTGDTAVGDPSRVAGGPDNAPEASSGTPAPAVVTADAAPPPPPPVEPPPPSPVPTQKTPTPVDSADAGDKTLAAVAPPSPPKPASQPQAVSVKTVPVVPGGVVNVQLPVPPRPPAGLAGSPKIPSVGNSSNW